MILLFTTDKGRYTWTPALEIVDFIPKGHRTPVTSRHVRAKKNPLYVAMQLAGITIDTGLLRHPLTDRSVVLLIENKSGREME